MANPITIIRDKAAWDAYCQDGRASLASWTPPEYPCAVVVAWTTPAFFTLDHARTLVALNGDSPFDRLCADAELAEARRERDDACAQLAKVRHDRDEMIRVHDEVEAQRDAAQAEAAAMRALMKCSGCGGAPTCYGVYEGGGVEEFCCDECCGHGNEDGWCKPIAGAGRDLAERIPLWRELERAVIEQDWRLMDGTIAQLAALDEAP